jgi:mono/diheme cytochrome c family protein
MRTLIIAGLLACLGNVAARAADQNPDQATYLRYCGACHGPGGKGDGVASSFMRPKPVDLTQIAKQNGGTFPTMRVMEAIDGRQTVRAHGDPQMPVWGEIFADSAAEPSSKRAEVRSKLMAIANHIRSIQEK